MLDETAMLVVVRRFAAIAVGPLSGALTAVVLVVPFVLVPSGGLQVSAAIGGCQHAAPVADRLSARVRWGFIPQDHAILRIMSAVVAMVVAVVFRGSNA